ncbi:hypothetical protein SAFG77S_00898 [Streptomyces afghaniensis]
MYEEEAGVFFLDVLEVMTNKRLARLMTPRPAGHLTSPPQTP